MSQAWPDRAPIGGDTATRARYYRVMGWDLKTCGGAGRAWLMLALLAVTLRVLAPPGYMLSPDSPTGYALCTSQGLQSPDQGPDAPASGGAMKDAPCVFAGLGAFDTPPSPLKCLRRLATASPPGSPPGPGTCALAWGLRRRRRLRQAHPTPDLTAAFGRPGQTHKGSWPGP
ncbi:MAG: hypothetical protein ACOYKF_11920 [Phenylobacterium sp.]